MEGEELAQCVRGGCVWPRHWRKDHRCPHLVVVCSIVTQACSEMEEIETKVSDVKAQLGFLVHQVVCMLGEQHGFLDSPSHCICIWPRPAQRPAGCRPPVAVSLLLSSSLQGQALRLTLRLVCVMLSTPLLTHKVLFFALGLNIEGLTVHCDREETAPLTPRRVSLLHVLLQRRPEDCSLRMWRHHAG